MKRDAFDGTTMLQAALDRLDYEVQFGISFAPPKIIPLDLWAGVSREAVEDIVRAELRDALERFGEVKERS